MSDQKNVSKYLTQKSNVIFAIKGMKTQKHVAKLIKLLGT